MDQIKSIISTIEKSNPVFSIPWQADIFVTAVSLSHNGLYRWGEWVDGFSSVINLHPQQQGETSEDAYYRQWILALENILSQKEVVSPADIQARTEQWRSAYLNTPHGHPVELSSGFLNVSGDERHDHHHHHHHHHHDHKECHDHHPEVRTEIKPLRIFQGAV